MTNTCIKAGVAAIGAAFCVAALADPMSKAEYQVARKDIESDYRTARIGCEPMTANVKDVCLADVNGRQEVAFAELEMAYAPGSKARYDLRIVKARADYSVARTKCNDKAGVAKDACMKEGEAISAAARLDAATQLKTAEASDAAKARAAPGGEVDPVAAKRDADYSIAREKCEVFTGGTKDLCASEAKRHYGKS